MVKKTIALILLLCFPCWTFAGIDFDGTDDYVTVADDASLDVTTISISVWIFWDDDGDVNEGIVSHANNSLGSNGWWFSISGSSANDIQFTFADTDFFSSGAISTGEWTHLAVTYDGSNVRFYKNGNADGVTASSASITNSADTFKIGREYNVYGTTAYLNGQITDLAVWSAVLTAGEIELLADSKIKRMPLQIQPTNLNGYWPMNDEPDGSSADGNTFIDQSGNGNNGTGDDGANNTGLTAKAEEVLSYQ